MICGTAAGGRWGMAAYGPVAGLPWVDMNQMVFDCIIMLGKSEATM